MPKESKPVSLAKASIFFAVIAALCLIVGYTLPLTLYIVVGWIFAGFAALLALLHKLSGAR